MLGYLLMADPPVHKPAGPHADAPSAEEFERLAARIKPSWELDEAPFTLGNRSLSAQDWEALHNEGASPSSRNGAQRLNTPSNGASAAPPAPAPPVNLSGSATLIGQPAADLPLSPPQPAATASPAKTLIGQPAASFLPPQPEPQRKATLVGQPLPPLAFPEPVSAPQARALSEPPRPPAPRDQPVVAKPQDSGWPPPKAKSSGPASPEASLLDAIEEPPKSRKGLFIGLAVAAVVLIGGIFFATRSSDDADKASPAQSASPEGDKGASVSNARVDIPPPQPPGANTPPPQPTVNPNAPPPAAKGEAAHDHAHSAAPPPPRPAPAPPPSHKSTPGGESAPAPSPKPSSKGSGGGIVRDVPF